MVLMDVLDNNETLSYWYLIYKRRLFDTVDHNILLYKNRCIIN